MFTLNVMEAIQEKYGSIETWSNLIQRDGEPDIKALKFLLPKRLMKVLRLKMKKPAKNEKQ